jgi:hypothetical protein
MGDPADGRMGSKLWPPSTMSARGGTGAMGPRGDASIGVALTVASASLWLQLLMLKECRRYAERALSSNEAEPGYDARQELKLNAALGLSLMQIEGPTPAGAIWTQALAVAERV